MKFTGKNLLLVRRALSDAIDNVHNEIGNCPSPNFYADDLDELEADMVLYEALAALVDRVLNQGDGDA